MILKTETIYFCLTAIVLILNTKFVFCKKSVLNFERPKILSYDKSYIKDPIVTSRRYNRSNPLYFVSVEEELLQPIDNTFVWGIYIYQLITRVYKQSFFDFSIGTCDALLTDNFIGKPFLEAYYRTPVEERAMKTLSCPLEPGRYKFKDLKATLFELPFTIPFEEGRLYGNLTRGGLTIFSITIDFHIKQV